MTARSKTLAAIALVTLLLGVALYLLRDQWKAPPESRQQEISRALDAQPARLPAGEPTAPGDSSPQDNTAAALEQPSRIAVTDGAGTLRLRLIWQDTREAIPFADGIATRDDAETQSFATDEAGSAEVNLRAGTWTISIARTSRQVPIEPGKATELLLEISDACTIEGTVVWEGTPPVEPVPEALVRVIRSGGGAGPTAVTDDDGAFAIHTFEDEFHFEVSAEEVVAKSENRYCDGFRRAQTFILPRRTVELEAIVTGEDGASLGGVALLVERSGQRKGPRLSVLLGARSLTGTTDDTGHCQFERITPGQWKLRAQRTPTAAFQEFRFEVGAAADVVEETFVLHGHSGRIDGVVRAEDGTPFGNANVRVHWDRDAPKKDGTSGRVVSVQTTDAAGKFGVDDVAPGWINVSAAELGNAFSGAEKSFVFRGGEEHCELVLPRSLSLEGRVTLASGTPGAGFRVFAEVAEAGGHTADCDQEGKFSVPSCPPRPFQVKVYADRSHAWGPLVVLEDVDPRDGPVAIEVPDSALERSHIRGRVLNRAGEEIRGARLHCFGALAGGGACDVASGDFVIGPAPSGRYTLAVQCPDGRSMQFECDHDGAKDTDAGTLVIPDPCRLIVELVAGEESLDAHVVYAWVDSGNNANLGSLESRAGAEMTWDARRPGRFVLHILGGDVANVDLPFEVIEGKTTRHRVELHRGVSLTLRVDSVAVPRLRATIESDDPTARIQQWLNAANGVVEHGWQLRPGTARLTLADDTGRSVVGELTIPAESADPILVQLRWPPE